MRLKKYITMQRFIMPKIMSFQMLKAIFYILIYMMSLPNVLKAEISNLDREVKVTARDLCNIDIAFKVVESREIFNGIGAIAYAPSCFILKSGKGLCNLFFSNRDIAQESLNNLSPEFVSALNGFIFSGPVSIW